MKELKNRPEVRFKGFDGEWTSSLLNEFCSYNTSFLSVSDTSLYGDYPLYDANGIIGFTNKNIQTTDYISIIKDGSGVGRVRLLPSYSSFIGTMGALHSTNSDINFLFAILQNIDFSKHITGATIPHVYYRDYGKELIHIPVLDEQSQIGTFFQHLDTLITQHQQKQNKLLAFKKAMLEKMFPKAGAAVPEIRFKGFEGKWEEKKLGEDIADIIGGGTPSTVNPEYWGGDIDWYSPTEIGESAFAYGSVKKITELGLQNSSAKLLPAFKTILFTSRAGIGDMAILQQTGATNQGFQSLVVKNGHHTYFLYSYGFRIKEFALKNASGSTFLEISGKMLAKMVLKTPSLEEQQKIGSFFQQLDKLIATQQTQIEKLQNLKRALLNKMFVQL